jgi:hypothetical protein
MTQASPPNIGGGRAQGAGRPTPSIGRGPACYHRTEDRADEVGEEQDREPQQHAGRRPGILQQQRDRAKRQAVAKTVSEQRVGRGIRREQLQASGSGEQDPADRVARRRRTTTKLTVEKSTATAMF